MIWKLPAHRAELPGKVFSVVLCPAPPYPAKGGTGLDGARSGQKILQLPFGKWKGNQSIWIMISFSTERINWGENKQGGLTFYTFRNHRVSYRP